MVIEASSTNCVDPDQAADLGLLVASILTLVNNVSKYMQQMTSADKISDAVFLLAL